METFENNKQIFNSHRIGELERADLWAPELIGIAGRNYILAQIPKDTFYKGQRISILFNSLKELNLFCCDNNSLIIAVTPIIFNNDINYLAILEFYSAVDNAILGGEDNE